MELKLSKSFSELTNEEEFDVSGGCCLLWRYNLILSCCKKKAACNTTPTCPDTSGTTSDNTPVCCIPYGS